jgi:anthranilate phosphoribosyltransferase
VVLNAAAALDVAGIATSLEDGIEKAVESIDSGASSEVLRRWVDVSRGSAS